MLSHLRSCLTPGSRRLSLFLTLLLCAVAAVSLAAGDRAQLAHAAATLKPGDFVLVAGSEEAVFWLDAAGDGFQTLTTNSRFGWPEFTATGPNGEVYVADRNYKISDFTTATSILRVNPSNGDLAIVSSGDLGSIYGFAVGREGSLFAADGGGEGPRISRIDPTTGARTTLRAGSQLINNPSGLAVEADGSLLTTVNLPSGPSIGPRQILRIRAGSNEPQVVSTGGSFVRPTSLTVGPDGSIFVIDSGGNLTPPRILKVHPQTGAQVVLTNWPNSALLALVVDEAGSLYALGQLGTFVEGKGLHRIDLQTGQPTTVRRLGISPLFSSIARVSVGSAVSCSPRPSVSVKTSNLGGGRLQVTVKASGSGNTIRSINPTTVPNADLEAQPTIAGPDATFVVKRTGPGAVTVRFTVTDGCGEWPSFVGGGPSAF